jgi:hypothetical protein
MGFLSKFIKSVPKSEAGDHVTTTEVTEVAAPQPKSKGGFKMRHQIELKLPKFLDPMFDNLTPEEKKKFGTVALTCGAAALGITVVYLTGYNRGIRKAIDNRGIYIVKGGE